VHAYDTCDPVVGSSATSTVSDELPISVDSFSATSVVEVSYPSAARQTAISAASAASARRTVTFMSEQ